MKKFFKFLKNKKENEEKLKIKLSIYLKELW
jgi:hypothetical protein